MAVPAIESPTAPVGPWILLAGALATLGLGLSSYGTPSAADVAAMPGGNRPLFTWLVCLAVALAPIADGVSALAAGLAGSVVTRQWSAAAGALAAIGVTAVVMSLAAFAADVETTDDAGAAGAGRLLAELEFAAAQVGHGVLALAMLALAALAISRGTDGLLVVVAGVAAVVLIAAVVMGSGVPLPVTGLCAAVVGGCALGSPGLRGARPDPGNPAPPASGGPGPGGYGRPRGPSMGPCPPSRC